MQWIVFGVWRHFCCSFVVFFTVVLVYCFLLLVHQRTDLWAWPNPPSVVCSNLFRVTPQRKCLSAPWLICSVWCYAIRDKTPQRFVCSLESLKTVIDLDRKAWWEMDRRTLLALVYWNQLMGTMFVLPSKLGGKRGGSDSWGPTTGDSNPRISGQTLYPSNEPEL